MKTPLKLIISFGLQGKKRTVEWFKEILDFPKMITFDGDRYEWIMYDRGHDGSCDWTLLFVKEKEGDPVPELPIPSFEDMFGSVWGEKCECGAIYTSFPNEHMFYCPKWRPAKI